MAAIDGERDADARSQPTASDLAAALHQLDLASAALRSARLLLASAPAGGPGDAECGFTPPFD
jgi:hypothetical protein